MNVQKIAEISRNAGSRLTRQSIAVSAGVALAVAGGVYANHLQVLSTDIVDGEVKTADIASAAVTSGKLAGSAVTSAKLAGNAVTSAKVQDNSLTGADIQESTLSGVDAATLGGIARDGLVRIGGATSSSVILMPDCDPGIDYITRSITVPWAGSVLVNASFTARWLYPYTSSRAIAARIERTAPTWIIGQWQESHLPPSGGGRGNIALTEVFDVPAGQSTFVLKVCDSYDYDTDGHTVRGQLTFVYTPNPRI